MENFNKEATAPGKFPRDDFHYGDTRRPWSAPFVEYMYAIVNHPNYQGMPAAVDGGGQIRWNAPSKRPGGTKHEFLHDERLVWWQQKADEIGEPRVGKWPSRVARKIHPFREKPCQTCGRVMLLDRIYPTKTTVGKLNRLLPEGAHIQHADFCTIYEVVEHVIKAVGGRGYEAFEKIFPQVKGCERSIEAFQSTIRGCVVPLEPRSLSPGFMSDAPDRLDGFHSYNICCRSKHDRGRDSDNMRSYGVDRRAFEQWVEGNWAAADALMHRASEGVCLHCGKYEMLTADHIGPISLGFMHRPRFLAVCHGCNSAKNNRMSLNDVKLLLSDEHSGDPVITQHASVLWDTVKGAIKSDVDANKVSSLLRINQHYYLMLLYRIYRRGYPDVLLHFLSPDYADMSFEFINVHPGTFDYDDMVSTTRKVTYAKSKAGRMVRIAFDSLEEYSQKEKRSIHAAVPDELSQPISVALFESLNRYSSVCTEFRKCLNSALGSDRADEDRDKAIRKVLAERCIDADGSEQVYGLMRQYMDAVGSYLADVFLEKGQTRSDRKALDALIDVGQEMLLIDEESELSEESDFVQEDLWADDGSH